MKCQICGRDNATIHIREIRNGEKKSYYLCEECAAKQKGPENILDIAEIVYNITNSLNQLQKGGKPEEQHHPDMETPTELRCETCGWSLEQLKKTGRFGCPECYHAFAEPLQGILENAHRGTVHKGKFPGMLSPEAVTQAKEERKQQELQKELACMQSSLDSAVAHEEYEKAAVIRDRMIALKKQMDPSSGKTAEKTVRKRRTPGVSSSGRKSAGKKEGESADDGK